MNKVEFRITYEKKLSPIGESLNELLPKLDLGISGFGETETDIVSYNTKTKITKKYINGMEKRLIDFYNKNSGKVIKIERQVIN